DFAAPVPSAIMGSTAILGFSVAGSSTTAADMLALLFVIASTDAFIVEAMNCALGSSIGVLAVEEFAPEFQPAAAAAALFGAGGSGDCAGVQEVSSSLESDEDDSVNLASGGWGSIFGADGGLGPVANFAEAAVFIPSETTVALGASAFFAVLPVTSRHFSRSAARSRPLW